MMKAIALGVALVATLTAAAPREPQRTVALKSSKFVPTSLTVGVGEVVVFRNLDPMYHSVTSNDLRFDSGAIAANHKWSHRFTKPGRYVFFCAYHPNMIATIVVHAK